MPGQPNWQPPERFEEYQLVRPLGWGGMGQVYLGHDTLLDRLVAIKFISGSNPSPHARRRFFIEAQAIARLQHPNVVAIYRIGEIAGQPYLISEYVRGTPLDKLPAPTPWQRVLEIGIGLARGLAAAHRRGVLHRDIKPANAVLTEDGEAKLLDFGVAKLVSPSPSDAEREDSTTASSPLPPPRAIPEQEVGIDDTVASAERAGPRAPGPTPAPAAKRDGAPRQVASPTERTVAEDDAAVAGPAGSKEAAAPAPARPLPVSAVPAPSPGSWLVAHPAVTAAGGVVGTPGYMAPEVWSGGASRRSDVYALGALLYTLCAGHPPFRGTSLEELRRQAASVDPQPLTEAVAGVDPGLARVIDRCLTRDPASRFASGDALREALEQLAMPTRSRATPEGNPYRGLAPFAAEHRDLFFGRGPEIRSIVDRLRAERFVLVAGDSGAGKSSVCRAGVLPAIADAGLGAQAETAIVTLLPGRRPLSALAATLAPLLGEEESKALARLEREPQQLARDLGQRRQARGEVLLFVDQMEELLTLAAPAEAAATAEALNALLLHGVRIRLLATVRSDFLARLASLPGLGDEVARAIFLLPRLSDWELREAIVGPAAASGLRFESEELVDELVSAAGREAGGLPLLQFTLAELWQARDQGRRIIPRSALEALGGVKGALASHADGVLASLLPAERDAARRILSRLVSAEGIRGRRTEGELCGARAEPGAEPELSDPAAQAALQALVRGRLLTTCKAEEGASGAYEIAHEALLHGWATLRGWLAADAGMRAARERLERAAIEWQRLGCAPQMLWGPLQLADIAGLAAVDLQPREATFVAASRRALRLRRWLRRGLAVAIPVVLLAVYGGVRAQARWQVQRRVEQRMREAERALAEARQGNAQVEELRRRAFAAFDAGDRGQGESEWTRVLELAQTVGMAYASASTSLESALALDSSGGEVRGLLADLTMERVLLAERDHRAAESAELRGRLGAYDDGGVRSRLLEAVGRVALDVQPAGTVISLTHTVADQQGKSGPPRVLGRSPLADIALPPGSYVLGFRAPGHVEVRLPLMLQRGELEKVRLSLPRGDQVPAGMVYVPAGRFLYGSVDPEALRRDFFFAQPLHEVRTPAYLVAGTEVTYGDWIEFLEALPAAERARRRPGAAREGKLVDLREDASGQWLLTMRPATQTYSAHQGQAIRYLGRDRRQVQDWLRLPVVGISYQDALAYAAWLDHSGRVKGARLCSEHEWERAARGADGRRFPGGDQLRPDDANFDLTYGRQPAAFGPDEVGSHPAGRSPFGVDDLAGNVWEWVTSVEQGDPPRLRGGSWYQARPSAVSYNREPGEPTMRDSLIGARICATPR